MSRYILKIDMINIIAIFKFIVRGFNPHSWITVTQSKLLQKTYIFNSNCNHNLTFVNE